MPTVSEKTNKQKNVVCYHMDSQKWRKTGYRANGPRSESSSKLLFPKDKDIGGTVVFAKTKGTSGKARFMLYVVSCPSHKERHSGLSNYARYTVLIYADNFDIKT